MSFLPSLRRSPAALLLASLACALAPRTAHATSCGPVEVDFIVPWTTGSLLDEDGPLEAGAPVPVDVRPRVTLHSDGCEGIDASARLTLIDADGVEVPGEPVKIQLTSGPALELVLDAPLEPGTRHQLCVGHYGCLSFRTTEEADAAPPTPTLSLDEPFFAEDEDGDWVVTDVVGQASWEPFLGAVWLEFRDARPVVGAAVVERDAESRGEGSAALSRLFRTGDEACVVAVARAADGALAESEPSCFTVQEPAGGCSIGRAAGRAGSAGSVGLALGCAALAGAVLRRRRRVR